MDETEVQDARPRRRPKAEAPEPQEPPATGDPNPESTQGQNGEGKRRQRIRRADGLVIGVQLGSSVKTVIRLPVRTWWRLKHHMADRPGKHEGEIIAPLLDEYLGAFDYPKQPDWLLQAMGKPAATEEVSAN